MPHRDTQAHGNVWGYFLVKGYFGSPKWDRFLGGIRLARRIYREMGHLDREKRVLSLKGPAMPGR